MLFWLAGAHLEDPGREKMLYQLNSISHFTDQRPETVKSVQNDAMRRMRREQARHKEG